MIARHFSFPLAVSAALLFLGAGCISVSTTGAAKNPGGVFRSVDRGLTWVNKNAYPTAKGVQSIGGANILSFAFDPKDSKVMYLGTEGSGIFFTTDGAETWQRGGGITSGKVQNILVDAKNSCVIYASLGNQIIKSNDCSRNYTVVYTDQRANAVITTIAEDGQGALYIGNAVGDLLRSSDAGGSWAPVNRWKDIAIGKVLPSAKPGRLYVATKQYGLARSDDNGKTWVNLVKTMDAFDGARDFVTLYESGNALVHVSRYGILLSGDNGQSWQAVNLLTPPKTVTITAAALNPKNANEMYYTTPTKLYTSHDAGMTWKTADLPTNKVASSLAVDPQAGNVLYLGVSQPK